MLRGFFRADSRGNEYRCNGVTIMFWGLSSIGGSVEATSEPNCRNDKENSL